MRRVLRNPTCIGLMAVIWTACGNPQAPVEERDPGPATSDLRPVAEFVGFVDVEKGTLEFRPAWGRSASGLAEATVDQNGTPGGNAPGTVELVTTIAGEDSLGGPGGNEESFYGDVTVTYNPVAAESLLNVYVETTEITPATGHLGHNSHTAHGAVSADVSADWGLWSYGHLTAAEPSVSRRWRFANPGGNFSLRGRVMAGNVLYKRVFVTSTIYNGILGGVSGADDKCQARLDAASLGGTWLAWLATDTHNAQTDFIDVEWRRLNGANTLASDLTDLTDGSLDTSVHYDEFGQNAGGRVWTGAQADGSTAGGLNCGSWSSDAGFAIYGEPTSSNDRWTFAAVALCTEEYPLYCFEQ